MCIYILSFTKLYLYKNGDSNSNSIKQICGFGKQFIFLCGVWWGKLKKL